MRIQQSRLRLPFFILLCALAAGLAAANIVTRGRGYTVAAAAPSEGSFLHWQMPDNTTPIVDQSGNENTGVTNAAPTYTAQDNFAGYWTTDGATDFIDGSSVISDLADATSGTFSVMFKAANEDDNKIIASFSRNADTNTTRFSIYADSTDSYTAELWTNGVLNWQFRLDANQRDDSADYWVMLSVTHDGNIPWFMVNGRRDTSIAVSNAPYAGSWFKALITDADSPADTFTLGGIRENGTNGSMTAGAFANCQIYVDTFANETDNISLMVTNKLWMGLIDQWWGENMTNYTVWRVGQMFTANDDVLSNGGNLSGAASSATPPSRVLETSTNYVMDFDAINDVMELRPWANDSYVVHMDIDMTIMSWVWLDTTNADSFLYRERKTVGSNPDYTILYSLANKTFQFYNNNDVNINQFWTSTANTGEWYHVAWTFISDGANDITRLYVNGSKFYDSTNNFSTLTPDTGFTIGRRPTAASYWDGKVDNFSVLSGIALTATDMSNYVYRTQQLYGVRDLGFDTGLLVRVEFTVSNEVAVGDIQDYGPYFNTGTNTGSAIPTWTESPNPHGTFNGSDQFVTWGVDSELQMGTSDMTVMAWVKQADTGVNYILGNKTDPGTTAGMGYAFYLQAPAIRCTLSDSTNRVVSTAVGVSPAAGVWMHIAAAIDRSDKVTFYTNGVSAGQGGSIAVMDGVNIQSAEFFGVGRGHAAFSFNGEMDDHRVYDRILSQAEIAAIMAVHSEYQ